MQSKFRTIPIADSLQGYLSQGGKSRTSEEDDDILRDKYCIFCIGFAGNQEVRGLQGRDLISTS
jgi:hypothetical protein